MAHALDTHLELNDPARSYVLRAPLGPAYYTYSPDLWWRHMVRAYGRRTMIYPGSAETAAFNDPSSLVACEYCDAMRPATPTRCYNCAAPFRRAS